jgi:hypothetical protein
MMYNEENEVLEELWRCPNKDCDSEGVSLDVEKSIKKHLSECKYKNEKNNKEIEIKTEYIKNGNSRFNEKIKKICNNLYKN